MDIIKLRKELLKIEPFVDDKLRECKCQDKVVKFLLDQRERDRFWTTQITDSFFNAKSLYTQKLNEMNETYKSVLNSDFCNK